MKNRNAYIDSFFMGRILNGKMIRAVCDYIIELEQKLDKQNKELEKSAEKMQIVNNRNLDNFLKMYPQVMKDKIIKPATKLGDRQRQFARIVPWVIAYAYYLGYEVSIGHAFRCQDCKAGKTYSNHKRKLAIDINLFIRPSPDERARYLGRGTAAIKAHERLHELWDILGGSEMIKWDSNHYSVEWRGIR